MIGGVMFHHFHDDKNHIVSQGSVSRDEFIQILEYLEKQYCLLDAHVWLDKAQRGLLNDNEVCITFDDTLKCQYEIAYPVLKERGLHAFWFIFTDCLAERRQRLEIYRHFRFLVYSDIDSFYDAFFNVMRESFAENELFYEYHKERFDASGFLSKFVFYSYHDRLFRYFRDMVLSPAQYDSIMSLMMDREGYDYHTYTDILWMNRGDVCDLSNNGQIIGLHSHFHHTSIQNLTFEEQRNDYLNNYTILKSLTGMAPSAVAYPCGVYNDDTEKIMRELDIAIGFDSGQTQIDHKLHYPRLDHALVLKQIRI